MRGFIPVFLLVCFVVSAHSQIKVDYRQYQSPVKNQVDRGTCTAFAVLAALETLPGFPTDLSEQYLYAAIKMNFYKAYGKKYEEGAALAFYADVLTSWGTVREDQVPYNPNAVVWDPAQTNYEKMRQDLAGTGLLSMLKTQPYTYKILPEMYAYRQLQQARDVAWIKQQLDLGYHCIPVSYYISGPYWSAHNGSRSSKIDPADFLKLADGNSVMDYGLAKLMYGNAGIAAKLDDGTLEPRYAEPLAAVDAGHAVAIVGYDESGFLIKNSWGISEWGDRGYGWVSFDYHELYAAEVMTLSLGKIQAATTNNAGAIQVKASDFRLKSLPHVYNNTFLKTQGKGLSVSLVYYGTAAMPRLTSIVYKGYDASGRELGTWHGNTQGIFDGRNTGYETSIASTENASSFPQVAKLVAEIKTADGQIFTNTYRNISGVNAEYVAQ